MITGIRPHEQVHSENPKDAVASAKVPLTLAPAPALYELARALQIGACKYGPYNWRVTKVRARVYIEAAMRHLLAMLDGEDLDPDTGTTYHAAHVMASMAIYMDAMDFGNLIDDRPIPKGEKLWPNPWTTGETTGG